MSRRRLQHLALLAGLLAFVVINAAAATPATPGFEVKFFLDPDKTLNANNVPTSDVLKPFQAAGPLSINMQFLDGPGLELHKAGWNVRFRTVEGKDEIQLTYKRRSSVPIGLDAALKRAEVEGFGKEEKKAEVEWGFQQRTLTFSREQNEPAVNPVLPLLADARTRALASVPDKLTPNGWAKGILSGAILYGPVRGQRWTGKHKDVDKHIDIEVWTLPGACNRGQERIVEISFKEDEREKAEKKREALLELIEKRGWLLPRDVLKTSLILERVRGTTR